ncbi:hypothetical protein CDD81_4243 [Ophiocordyceps australis]|uniref:Probable guanine deaminase n=1 Tax=Ophiocordyceps australis TaxID=1399860 RepID=A0A2C5YBK3_9HYPO|nr:hypothetical protein CDD81_4243 [Ophiocordyceps australis]
MEAAGRERRRLLLLGTFVQTKADRQLQVMQETAIAVDEQGVIVGIERAQQEGQDAHSAGQRLLGQLGWEAESVDECSSGPEGFFFPGLIDTHVHAAQYANVGLFGKTTLLDWLERYTFPLEASLCDVAKARRMWRACVDRTLAHGTTTAAYYGVVDVEATNALMDECVARGQRALVGRVCMDAKEVNPAWYRDETAAEALEATLRTVEHARRVDAAGALVEPVLTPRFAPSCSMALMEALGKLQREEGLAVQTHLSETREELALVRRLFPDAASYTAVYDAARLLTPRTILAHGIHLGDDEARLIAQRGSSVAHCPCSNTALASGRARVGWLWRHGIAVGLGTDMSGGYSPSVLEAARQALLVSRNLAMDAAANPDAADDFDCNLSVDDVLFLATRGGAIALGLDHKIGAFDLGLQWDAQLIHLDTPEHHSFARGNVDVFGWESCQERVAKWLFNGDDRNTLKVWVQGRLVHSRPVKHDM